MSDVVRVIIDCDTANEIDDQLAIAHALGSPALDVIGVVSVQNTTASGPNSSEIFHEEAQKIVALSGAADRVPCFRGAAAPMEDIDTAARSEGLDFIMDAARQGPLTILATGPATDVASLALLDPALREQVNIIWAGAFYDEQTWLQKKFGELNARADIASWRRLYLSSGPLRVLPGWPGVEKIAVQSEPFAASLRALGSPIGDYLAQIFAHWTTTHNGLLDMDDTGESQRGKVLWDIANVAVLTRPDSVHFTRERLPYVDPAGVPDWSRPGREAEITRDLDADAILEDFWEALKTLPVR